MRCSPSKPSMRLKPKGDIRGSVVCSRHYRIISSARGKSLSPFSSQSQSPRFRAFTKNIASTTHKAWAVPPHSSDRSEGSFGPFHAYLEKNNIALSALKIEHCDDFLATFNVSDHSRRIYRNCLRGFLKYLYHEPGILKRDLAPLLVGPPQFAQRRLPRFLRPQQVKKLFASLKLSTPTQIRTYAMVHLASSLGLRPVEISRITLGRYLLPAGGDHPQRKKRGRSPHPASS